MVTSLLPYLRLNEVLRLRRTCQRMNSYAAEHLRMHPRSSGEFQIGPPTLGNYINGQTMGRFLQRDAMSGIPMPISKLVLDSVTYGKFMRTFLKRYGQQIQHLEVSRWMRFPLSPSAHVLFKKLPKLRSLTLGWIVLHDGIHVQLENTVFPPCFKHLKRLDLRCSKHSPILWKIIEVCVELEDLVLPAVKDRDTQEAGIRCVQGILDRQEHKNLRYLSTSKTTQVLLYGSHISSVLELRIKHDLELVNVSVSNLYHSGINVYGGINVFSLPEWGNIDSRPVVQYRMSGLEEDQTLASEICSGIHSIGTLLTPAFPTLRKLDLEFANSPIPTDSCWGNFPTLEEMSLTFNIIQREEDTDNNQFFFGSNEEHPAFLQLAGKSLDILFPHFQSSRTFSKFFMN